MKNRYQPPTQSLRIAFDPITWQALKDVTTGSMERTAYLMIQERLGLTVVAKMPSGTDGTTPGAGA